MLGTGSISKYSPLSCCLSKVRSKLRIVRARRPRVLCYPQPLLCCGNDEANFPIKLPLT
jgi:hypothetical protein